MTRRLVRILRLSLCLLILLALIPLLYLASLLPGDNPS